MEEELKILANIQQSIHDLVLLKGALVEQLIQRYNLTWEQLAPYDKFEAIKLCRIQTEKPLDKCAIAVDQYLAGLEQQKAKEQTS
jgi:hypothetical protein